MEDIFHSYLPKKGPAVYIKTEEKKIRNSFSTPSDGKPVDVNRLFSKGSQHAYFEDGTRCSDYASKANTESFENESQKIKSLRLK